MTDNNNNNDTNNKLRLQQTRGIITELYGIDTEIIKPSNKGGEGSPYCQLYQEIRICAFVVH